MSTDQQLVEEILKGSASATEVLTRKYYKMVYAFVYRMTGDKDTSYDLTQEVFIKMIKYIEKFQATGEFRNWLLTIASNHCKDYFRSKTYQKRTQESEFMENIAPTTENISYIFEKNEKRKVIKEALDQLPDFQKEAIILKYFHNKKVTEIAEIMDTNDSTIKSRLKQGLDKLKRYLKGSVADEDKQQSK
jgi:RNA polymerase sigma factor (sigma-70 family)